MGRKAPPVTSTARIERIKRETGRESDLVIAACLRTKGQSIDKMC